MFPFKVSCPIDGIFDDERVNMTRQTGPDVFNCFCTCLHNIFLTFRIAWIRSRLYDGLRSLVPSCD